LYLNQNILESKQEIDIQISGSVENILWATDDELSSFTISTRALARYNNYYDFRITTHDVSSRILHFKRNVNSISPFNWRQTSEQNAFGSCDYGPIQTSTNLFDGPNGALDDDDLDLSAGIYRTCDLYCRGKNYALSTFSLIEDQLLYNSKTTGYYLKYQALGFDPLTFINSYYKFATRFENSSITTIDTRIRSPFFKNFVPVQNYDNNSIRFFKCNFGIKSYRIHRKENNYYYEDFSYTQNTGIDFSRPFLQSLNLITNTSIPTQLSVLSQLTSKAVTTIAAGNEIIPTFSQNALWSSTSCTENFIVFAFLYQYINNSNNNSKKNLVVIKLPFNSYDNKTVFRYFMESSAYSSIIPSMAGYGLVSNFLTTNSTPVLQQYFDAARSQTPSPSVESPDLANKTFLTTPNIDQLTTFKLFTSDDRYFLCTDNQTIVWTYSSGTYVIKNINLKLFNFYYISSGEYFVKGDIIYKYNPATMEFDQKTIG
jgi:hypothetical protein